VLAEQVDDELPELPDELDDELLLEELEEETHTDWPIKRPMNIAVF
jgi:hypothetical protein